MKWFRRLLDMLRDARADLLAFSDFPVAHWKKIWSTNPLERVHKEIKPLSSSPRAGVVVSRRVRRILFGATR